MSLIQRQPTNTIGMRADWSMPPAKDRKIHVSKSELAVCSACCCSVNYVDFNHGCFPFCHLTKQFLCFANDCKCLGGPLAGDNDDKTLGLFCTLYGLTCYPKFGCCQQVKYYYPPDEFPELSPKADYLPCLGGCMCCCTDLCTTYLKMPTTLCSMQGYVWACCYGECAMPCDKDMPVACGCPWLPGLMLYPKVACCPKAVDYFEVASLTEALDGPATTKVEVIDAEPKKSTVV